MNGWEVVLEGTKLEADLAGAALEAAGIDARVLSDSGTYFPGAAADSRVLVPTEQAAAAREIIRQGAG
ncbi:MAG: putative signal transducing protein [Candidatus Dormibacterales bacterium]